MTFLGWAIVFVLNGAIIVYGFFLARKTESSNDWFLAGRSLPWWGLGLSMFATSLDNGDVISLSGKVYNNGIHIITVFTLATVVGACLCASVRHANGTNLSVDPCADPPPLAIACGRSYHRLWSPSLS
jgi:SSS family solute:Na+ symporter